MRATALLYCDLRCCCFASRFFSLSSLPLFLPSFLLGRLCLFVGVSVPLIFALLRVFSVRPAFRNFGCELRHVLRHLPSHLPFPSLLIHTSAFRPHKSVTLHSLLSHQSSEDVRQFFRQLFWAAAADSKPCAVLRIPQSASVRDSAIESCEVRTVQGK